MTYRCTVCGARVAITPTEWLCIDPECGETWELLSDSDESENEDEDSEPPAPDRIPERERIEQRERQREDDGRAERSRLGLDQ